MPVPDSLKEKMELFRRRGRIVKYREGVFLDASWIAVYIGQGILPQSYDMRAGLIPEASLTDAMKSLRTRIRTAAEAMPEHREHIEHYCPMPDAA
jgi:tryptophan halogenase